MPPVPAPPVPVAPPEPIIPPVPITQLGALQTMGATQSICAAQEVLQAVELAQVREFGHGWAGSAGPAVPLPVHCVAPVSWFPVQLGGAACMPAAVFSQAPARQFPVLPHGETTGKHIGSAVASGTGPQCPDESQAWQAPLQAASQQWLSVQKVEPQSVPAVHIAPSADLSPHLCVTVLQVIPAMQSAFVVQDVLHCMVSTSQTYPPHDVTVAVGQAPFPLH
jgi:hypothetical protein